MTIELTYLVWTLVLGIAQIFIAAAPRVQAHGFKWSLGARDEASPPSSKIGSRLERAQANLFETLPLFIGAALVVHAAHRESGLTALGAALYFWGRLAYVPLYAFGVPVVRSLVFGIALCGLLLLIYAGLRG